MTDNMSTSETKSDSPRNPEDATPAGGAYPRVDLTEGSTRFADMEPKVLDFWKKDRTFEESIIQRDGAPEYVFYDGPPFANGLPHYGHLLTGYVKDIIPRYQTMRGKKVARVFGWDCHGLPAELEAEKQLGIKDKGEISRWGSKPLMTTARSPSFATPRNGRRTSPGKLGGLISSMATKP